jgi:hypothetical protein
MTKTYSSSCDPLIARQRPHCPKCDARMRLARVAPGPPGFDVGTFDCAKCDHVHIVTVATDLLSDTAACTRDRLMPLRKRGRCRPELNELGRSKRRAFSVELLTIRG